MTTEWAQTKEGFAVEIFGPRDHTVLVLPYYEFRWTEEGLEFRYNKDFYRLVLPQGVAFLVTPLPDGNRPFLN